ncbi:hypothetical protein [Neolewinella agarilytica]|uniref:hypothetical protein n=1 Tax=Neolewinella agarilytica TaxID=478744 RepID=UPI002353F986|nr:hypothetical protein [Neolewinella agarilytica]
MLLFTGFSACEKDNFIPEDISQTQRFDKPISSSGVAKYGKLTASEISSVLKSVSSETNKSIGDPIAILDSVIQTTGLVIEIEKTGVEVITFFLRE